MARAIPDARLFVAGKRGHVVLTVDGLVYRVSLPAGTQTEVAVPGGIPFAHTTDRAYRYRISDYDTAECRL